MNHCSRSRYHGRTDPATIATLPAESVPGVTILRPLRGLDCNLYENLEASFLQVSRPARPRDRPPRLASTLTALPRRACQEYPKFEIIFSVADEADHAIPIVHDLMNKYPHVPAKLIIG